MFSYARRGKSRRGEEQGQSLAEALSPASEAGTGIFAACLVLGASPWILLSGPIGGIAIGVSNGVAEGLRVGIRERLIRWISGDSDGETITSPGARRTRDEDNHCGTSLEGRPCSHGWRSRLYLPFLASFLSFFSFGVSLGLFVFAVRFLS